MTKDLHALVSAADARSLARQGDDAVRMAAERAGKVDVSFGTLGSPLGELFVDRKSVV